MFHLYNSIDFIEDGYDFLLVIFAQKLEDYCVANKGFTKIPLYRFKSNFYLSDSFEEIVFFEKELSIIYNTYKDFPELRIYIPAEELIDFSLLKSSPRIHLMINQLYSFIKKELNIVSFEEPSLQEMSESKFFATAKKLFLPKQIRYKSK